MTSVLIVWLYSVQFLTYGAMSCYLAVRVYRNGLRHDIHLLVAAMCAVFGTQALIQLYRLVIRAQALAEGRPTGLDSPFFAFMVAANAAAMVTLFVTFRRSIGRQHDQDAGTSG